MKHQNQQTNRIRKFAKSLVRTIKGFSAVMALVAFQAASSYAQVSFSVYAGTTGSPGYSGDGGSRLSAQFHDPWGIAIDNYNGLLYVVDFNNHAVRQINIATNIIKTYAGGTPGFAGDGGPATAASLQNPTGITIDGAGNIYIYDIWNYRIRMVDPSGIINTVIGNGIMGYSGDGGPANLASIGPCNGLSSDFAGNIYLPSYIWDKIRTVTPSTITTSGTINYFAGSTSGFSGDGFPLSGSEQFNYLNDLKYDWNTGDIYISDWGNNRIRKIDASGNLSTFAGSGVSGYLDPAPAATAPLNGPMGFDLNCEGTLYFCDVDNHAVRRIKAGTIETIAGAVGGPIAGSGDGSKGSAGQFNRPVGLAVDAIGDIYVSDRNNHRIVKLTFDARVCVQNTITLCDKTGTGTWSSSNPGVASIDAATGVVMGHTPGTTVITLTIGGYTLTKIVTVTAPPAPITGPTTVAVGSTILLSDAVPGGTWSSSGPGATVGSSTGVVTGVSPGVVTITYTMSPNCFEIYTVSVEQPADTTKKCIDDAKLTIVSGTDARGNCIYTATVTVATGNIIVGYEWTLPAPAGIVVVHTSSPTDVQSFTLPAGTGFLVHVKIHVVRTDWKKGESPCCDMDLDQVVRCDGRSQGCFDEVGTTISAVGVPGSGDPTHGTPCDFTVTANAVLLPGMTLVGYEWNDGTGTYFTGLTNTFMASLVHLETRVITVTIYALDAAGNPCQTTRTITLECMDGIGTSYKPVKHGDNNELAANGINIHPNPTSGEVEISSGDTEIQNVQVIDVNGKKMGSYDFTQTKSAKVSLSNFPPGNYLFRVNNSTSKVVTKIK